MEKYAVETSVDKTASAETHCPKCGRVVEQHGCVSKCSVHGTEAFENEAFRATENESPVDLGSEPPER